MEQARVLWHRHSHGPARVTNKDDTEQQGWADGGVAGSPLGSLTPQPWKQSLDTMLGKPSPLSEKAGGACDIMTHLPCVQETAP